MKFCKAAIFLSVVISLPLAQSNPYQQFEQSGRYLLERKGPTLAEEDPLAAVTQLRFPHEVQSPAAAIDHALFQSGYQLDWSRSGDARRVLRQKSLPLVHRELGKMPLYTAISTLAGQGWTVAVDRVQRRLLISQAERSPEHSPWDVADVVPAKADIGDLGEPVAVHKDAIQLRDLLIHLIPDGWKLTLQIPDFESSQIVAFHSETTRRRALEGLLRKLNLKGIFYPGAGLLLVTNPK